MSTMIENNTHECQDCGMKFYNSHELVNHMRKFCVNAGLHSLDGLANYQQNKGFSKKQKQAAYSMGSMKYQPAYDPNELAKQAIELQKHRDQLSAYRHYSSHNQMVEDRQKGTDFNKYNRSNLKNVPHYKPSSSGNIVKDSASRIFGTSDISIKPLNDFGNVNHPYSASKRTQHEHKDSYISPPSQLPTSAFVKRNIGPSMLDKSNSSIAKMSGSQKKNYAVSKLLQLDNIEAMYNESGGMSMQFRKNMQKMRKFYNKMMNQSDLPLGGNYPGQFVQSRAQTPISKLRDLNANQDDLTKVPTRKNMGQYDSLDRQLQSKMSIKLNDQQSMRNTNSNRIKQQSQNKNIINKSKKRQQIPSYQSHQFSNQPFNPYQMPYANNFGYPAQTSPQIIMMPPYPQQQNQNQNSNINDQIKYLQKMMEMKNEQNKKLMKMLMDTKRNKDKQEVKERLSRIHQSRVSDMRRNSFINQIDPYHFETPLDNTQPTPQQKILIALQREELDELRLLSQIPEELQQIKMQSVMRLIEQRTKLQKQILEQKMKRLEEQNNNQLFEQKRRLENDDWVAQERMQMINQQMDDYLHQYQNQPINEDQENSDEGQPYPEQE